jgi:hypothetical protein
MSVKTHLSVARSTIPSQREVLGVGFSGGVGPALHLKTTTWGRGHQPGAGGYRRNLIAVKRTSC